MPEEPRREKSEAEKLVESLLEKVSEDKKEIDDYRAEVKTSAARADEALSSLSDSVEATSDKIDNVYRSFEWISWAIPFTVLVVYFGAIYSYGQFGLNAVTLEGIAVVLPLILALRLVIWVLWTQIQPEKTSYWTALKRTFNVIHRHKYGVSVDSTNVNDRFGVLGQLGNKLTVAVKSYVPGLDAYYQGRERLHEQKVFITTLRNALQAYGFPVKGAVESEFTRFGPKTNTADEWIDEIAPILASLFTVADNVTRLAYYDYQGDLPSKTNVWNEIVGDKVQLSAFTRRLIENRVVDTDYLEKGRSTYRSVEAIVRLSNPFDLKDFIQTYNQYYGEFARQKNSLLDSLMTYGVDLPDSVVIAIKEFTPSKFYDDDPSDPDKDTKLEELFTEVPKRIPINRLLLELFYYERNSKTQKRVEAWEKLIRDDSAIDNLISILTAEGKGLVDIPTFYEGHPDKVREFISGVLKTLPDFTLARGRSEIKAAFASLETEKQSFLNSARSNNLLNPKTDLKPFDSLLPIGDRRSAILAWLHEQTGVHRDFLLLFYLDYTLQTIPRKNLFIGMDKSKRKELAGVLISHKVVTGVEISDPSVAASKSDSENLAQYLFPPRNDYDRSDIQVGFSQYNSLFENGKGMLEVLKKERVFPEDLALEYQQILDAVPDSRQSTSVQLEGLLRYLIKGKAGIEFPTPGWEDAFVVASLAFYLVKQEVYLYVKKACERAAGLEDAARILYNYSRINEDETRRNVTPRTSFKDIALKTIDGSYLVGDYESFEPFREELGFGNFYLTLSSMMAVKINRISPKLEEMYKEAAARNTVALFGRALNRLFETRLKARLIEQSLRTDLVSAYLVTTPSSTPIFTRLLRDYLPEACKQFTQEDSRSPKLWITTGVKVGKSVRLGLVPYNMPFDRFADSLEKAFWLAVDRYVARDSKYKREDFSLNIARVYPSKAFFRQFISPSIDEKKSEDSIAKVMDRIGELMTLEYDPFQNLTIIASLENVANDSLAISSLLMTALNEKTTLLEIAGSDLRNILTNPKLRGFFENGAFDQQLIGSLGEKRAELALSTFRNCGSDDKLKTKRLDQFEKVVSSILRQARIPAGPKRRKEIAALLFEDLYQIGLILDASHAIRATPAVKTMPI